jgi:hypothetical protein
MRAGHFSTDPQNSKDARRVTLSLTGAPSSSRRLTIMRLSKIFAVVAVAGVALIAGRETASAAPAAAPAAQAYGAGLVYSDVTQVQRRTVRRCNWRNGRRVCRSVTRGPRAGVYVGPNRRGYRRGYRGRDRGGVNIRIR